MSKKRKRLKKLIMGAGHPRDVAELIIEVWLILGLDYQEQISAALQVLEERKPRSGSAAITTTANACTSARDSTMIREVRYTEGYREVFTDFTF